MIFIWGSYARSAMLHETAFCKRCHAERPIEFQRVWRTGHFFFFPLFSYSEAVLSRCQTCGREGVSDFPRPLPARPFLDRLGFTIPLGAIGAVFLAFAVLVATAKPSHSAPRSPVSLSGESLRRELDRDLGSRDVFQTDAEGRIANEIRTVVIRNLSDTRVHAAVRLLDSDGMHKRAVVLVEVKNLRALDNDKRTLILEVIRDSLSGMLAPADEAVVGVKGTLLYGAFGAGPVGSAWQRSKVDVAVNDELDAALGEAVTTR